MAFVRRMVLAGVHRAMLSVHVRGAGLAPSSLAPSMRRSGWRALCTTDTIGDDDVTAGVVDDVELDGLSGEDDMAAAAAKEEVVDTSTSLPPPPPEIVGEVFLEEDPFATTDADDPDDLPSPMFGDDLHMVPPDVFEQVAVPLDLQSGTDSETELEYDAREALMSPEEIERNRRRLYLKRMLEDPLPIPSRPLWPLYSVIVSVDQVSNKTAMGSIPSTKVLVVVGNYHGAAGFGIGKHKDARVATKYALRRAQRDMIHVSTRDGQLFHDLMGRKNNTKVLIRSVPPSKPGSAPSLIRMVFALMGIKHASAKILGSKRRNQYTVVQALFDAFHNHTPPEEDAFNRGLRMQWMGADRHNPRNYYPSYPKGPRHVPERFRNRG